VIKLVLEREEITVLYLFSKSAYLRGIWWKEYKY